MRSPQRNERPIGMFDSGFGGLTVARAVLDLLPDEDVVYLGDTGRYPYGPRPANEVRQFSLEIAEYLVTTHDVKALVVACNTATAAALDDLRDRLKIPVLGVIAPGVRAVVEGTDAQRIGVIGTVGTVASGSYQAAVAAMPRPVEAIVRSCPGFVEFVERGVTDGPEIQILAERMLAPIIEADVQALLLGCTHYPYLARVISGVLGPDVLLVSSADETAFALADLMQAEGLAHPDAGRGRRGHRTTEFISSGDVAAFTQLGSRLLGPELVDAHHWRHPHAP